MLSGRQQSKLQPLVKRAWQIESATLGLDETDKPARRAWYENQLTKSVGYNSTKPMDQGRDFEFACAHFEEMIGEDFHWQQVAQEGDIKRIRWSMKDDSITPEYCSGIAKQMHRMDHLPALYTLSKGQISGIIRALKIDARRR